MGGAVVELEAEGAIVGAEGVGEEGEVSGAGTVAEDFDDHADFVVVEVPDAGEDDAVRAGGGVGVDPDDVEGMDVAGGHGVAVDDDAE